jgi:hypothetical protein
MRRLVTPLVWILLDDKSHVAGNRIVKLRLPLTMTRAWNPGMTCQGCKPSTHTPLDERGLIKCPLCSALRTQVGHFAKTAKCPTAPLTLARDVPIATSYAPYESSWGGTSRPGPPPTRTGSY